MAHEPGCSFSWPARNRFNALAVIAGALFSVLFFAGSQHSKGGRFALSLGVLGALACVVVGYRMVVGDAFTFAFDAGAIGWTWSIEPRRAFRARTADVAYLVLEDLEPWCLTVALSNGEARRMLAPLDLKQAREIAACAKRLGLELRGTPLP